MAKDFIHWPSYVLAPLVAIPIFIKMGLYRAVVRYIGYQAQWVIIKAVTLSILVWAVFTYFLAIEQSTPRSVIFIFGLLLFLQ